MKKLSVAIVVLCLSMTALPLQAQPFWGQRFSDDDKRTTGRMTMTPPSEEVREARRNLKVTIMKERLSLSNAQASKIDGILKSFQKKALKDYEETKSDIKERRERAWVRKQEKEVAILNVLNDEQKKQFAIMKGERGFHKMARCGGKKGHGPKMRGGF